MNDEKGNFGNESANKKDNGLYDWFNKEHWFQKMWGFNGMNNKDNMNNYKQMVDTMNNASKMSMDMCQQVIQMQVMLMQQMMQETNKMSESVMNGGYPKTGVDNVFADQNKKLFTMISETNTNVMKTVNEHWSKQMELMQSGFKINK